MILALPAHSWPLSIMKYHRQQCFHKTGFKNAIVQLLNYAGGPIQYTHLCSRSLLGYLGPLGSARLQMPPPRGCRHSRCRTFGTLPQRGLALLSNACRGLVPYQPDSIPQSTDLRVATKSHIVEHIVLVMLNRIVPRFRQGRRPLGLFRLLEIRRGLQAARGQKPEARSQKPGCQRPEAGSRMPEASSKKPEAQAGSGLLHSRLACSK